MPSLKKNVIFDMYTSFSSLTNSDTIDESTVKKYIDNISKSTEINNDVKSYK